MRDKVCIVTGPTSGIGLEIARGLAERGATVVLAARDRAKADAVRARIGGDARFMALDLASLASVRAFAAEYRRSFDRLDVLVNNAGIHTARDEVTVDGVELTFQTNHLGHFLLTKLLLDPLRAAAPSRVVTVASEAHRGARRVDLDGLARGARGGGIFTYAQSKLANIQFAFALARRLEGTGVTSNAAHPGSVRTGWARGAESGLFRAAAWAASPFLLSPERGARTPLYVATAPELARVSGGYFVRMREKAPTAAARDVAAQEALWATSERLVGLRSGA